MFVDRIATYIAGYAPQRMGAGEPLRRDASNLNNGSADFVAKQPRDEYIPSFPLLSGQTGFAPQTSGAPFAPNISNTENASEAIFNENAGDNVADSDNSFDDNFTPEELRVIDDLQARDREVRAHEQAHVAVGGAYITGGVNYQYQVGPDNRRYAVGGEVGIDSSPIRDNPEATIAKMQVVRAAATAPANPSEQDMAVAAAASREEARASAELSERRAAEIQGERGADGTVTANMQNGSNNQSNDTEQIRIPKMFAIATAAYTNNNPGITQMLFPTAIDIAV